MTTPAVPAERLGRPRLREDDEILTAALGAFAAHGYESMSVRSLNTELGLSHGTINQRFKSKEQLWFAAIDHGFATFLTAIAEERSRWPRPVDELDELRRLIHAFLVAAIRRPELGRLMNQEGLHPTSRLDYIVRTVMVPAFEPIAKLLQRLATAGRIHPTPARTLFFLVAHGAEAPYTLTALSDAFDPFDGPLDPVAHAGSVTDVILRGITRG